MPILDRYIVGVFSRIFLVCFVSFAGLYVVVDAFTNLEEFLDLAETRPIAGVLVEYYGPRVLQFFDRTSAFIALVAAVFSLALMQRSNELVAIQAGGISLRRVARPVLAMTLVILAVAVVNREVLIPRYRNQIAMNAQDLSLGKGRAVGITQDRKTGIILRAQEVMPASQEITIPEFNFPPSAGVPGNILVAEKGVWLPASGQRPAGYLVDNPQETFLTLPANLMNEQGQTIVYVPAATDWLRPIQAFVPTEVDTVQLAFASQLARTASLTGMVEGYRLGMAGHSSQTRVAIHARIVQPFFDLSILMIGLPLVIARGQRNLFLSAGVCAGVVMMMTLILFACHALGTSRILNPPALSAWLPLILFAPLARIMYGLLR